MIQKVSMSDLGMHVRAVAKDRYKGAVKAVRMTMKEHGRRVVHEEILATKPIPFDRGNYDRSWKASDIDGGARIASSSTYASTIDGGRRPGTLPNVQALVGWARRHGMTNPTSAAWAIAIAIKRRGLPAKRVFARAKLRLIELCRGAAHDAISGAPGKAGAA